ncbi:Uncharacterised protein [Raoultella ornithinolytica]|nr:Uncharacterised protein [Raoultella ornithinolytica]
MLHFTQPHHLRRQDIQRTDLILHTLADILHHQHILALIFIIFHQPVGQQLRLAIVRMAGNGPGQCFGAQQRPTPAPKPLRR